MDPSPFCAPKYELDKQIIADQVPSPFARFSLKLTALSLCVFVLLQLRRYEMTAPESSAALQIMRSVNDGTLVRTEAPPSPLAKVLPPTYSPVHVPVPPPDDDASVDNATIQSSTFTAFSRSSQGQRPDVGGAIMLPPSRSRRSVPASPSKGVDSTSLDQEVTEPGTVGNATEASEDRPVLDWSF
jgi:hypothetical protein